MPDDPTSTFDQRAASLAAIERKSRARSAMSLTVTPYHAQLANQAALVNPQVARTYPGALAVAAQTGDKANVDAVVQGGTKAKNDSGDWWNPGDALGAVASSVASVGEAVGSGLSTASAAVSQAAMPVAKGITRAVTAGAQSAYQLTTNVFENRTPLSSDVIHMGLGDTVADEAARQAYGEQLGRISQGGITDPGGIVSQAAATDVGQIVKQVAAGGPGAVDMGSGFFPGGAVATGQSAAARQVRGIVPGTVTPENPQGQARTVGRDVAVVFTEPGTNAYRILSGFVDASTVLLTDPVNRLHPFKGLLTGAGKEPLIVNASHIDEAKLAVEDAAGFVRDHPNVTPDLRDAADEAVARINEGLDSRNVKQVKKAANQLSGLVARLEPAHTTEAQRFAAGLVDGVRKTVHAPTTEQFIQANNDLMQRFADDDSFLSIFHRLNHKVDPRIAIALKDAETAPEVAGVFRSALGGAIPNAPGKAYSGPLGEGLSQITDWVKDHRLFADMPGKELIADARGASAEELIDNVRSAEDALINAKVPAHTRDDLVEAYARSLTGTAQDSYDAGRKILDMIEAQIEHIPTLRGHVSLVPFEPGASAAEKAAGRAKSVAREIVMGMADDRNVIRSWAKDAQGNPTDYGLVDALRGSAEIGATKGLAPSTLPGLETLTASGITSPVQLEQGIRRAIDLPDPRVIRRLTASPIMRAITTQGFDAGSEAAAIGLQRVPFAAMDWMTNQFKRLAVMRAAFIPRVVGEEMVYLGVAGGPAPFTHPIHWFALATDKDFRGADILGQSWETAPVGTLPREATAFQNAINVGIDVADSSASTKLVHASGDASIAHKGVDSVRWDQGHSDHLAAFNSNPMKRLVAEGASTDDIMKFMRSKEGAPDLQELQGLLERKGILYDDGTRLNLDLSADSVLRTYIDTVVRGDVARIAGDNPVLLQAIATGRIAGEPLEVANTQIAAVISRGTDSTGASAWVGSKVRMKDGTVGEVTGEPGKGLSTIETSTPAWSNREPSAELRSALAEWQANPDSADAIDVWTRPVMRRAMTPGDTIERGLQKVTKWFFGYAYGKTSDYLVRAPFFKQTYWDELEKMIPNLSPGEANKALKMFGRHSVIGAEEDFAHTYTALERRVLAAEKASDPKTWSAAERAAYDAGNWRKFSELRGYTKTEIDDFDQLMKMGRGVAPDRTVPYPKGSPHAGQMAASTSPEAILAEHPLKPQFKDAQLDRLIAKARTANGTLDLEAADELAKGRALDTMHDTFYDWSRKGQFFDITRNIFPFGEAWKEMLTRYARLAKTDPVTTLRKAQLIVNGKNDSGWFTRDAQTGLENFNMPLTGPLAKILTGNDVQASASVKGLTIGADVIPGLGPVAQIAIANFLPDLPSTQGLEDVLFPYGRPKGTLTSGLPSWMQSAYSAVFDKRNTTRLYGNTYYDIFKQLAASGDYNLSDQNEVSRMMDAAASKARPLSILKAALQFVSPSSPTFDTVVKTKGGDVLSALIIDDLDAMRKANPNDYTAEFLSKYGEQAFIYLQGRTKAVLGGLDLTTAFGDWQQTHRDAVQAHPDVAGYFAPTGGDFDFEVWRRQLSHGERKYLSDREIIDAAQATMGRWQYYAVRDVMGPKITQAQSVQLSQLRKLLAQKYPGYDPSGDSTPSKVAHRVDELRDAKDMPDLKDTDVGKALHSYFAIRDTVDAQAVKSGVTTFTQAKQFAVQREEMRQLGELLSQKYPSFRRVFDDVLSREMKDDTPEDQAVAP